MRLFPTAPTDLLTTVWTGGYPAIFDRGVPAGESLGAYAAMHFLRDSKGYEVDLLVADGQRWLALEIKSARTVAADFFTTLEALPGRIGLPPGVRTLDRAVVHGGDEARLQRDLRVVPWSGAAGLLATG